MGWKKITVLLLLFTTIGCNTLFKNYYYTEKLGLRPKTPKYKLTKTTFGPDKNNLIDENSIYINEREIIYKNGGREKKEYFLRFFTNGKCVWGYPYDFKRKTLNIEDINNMSRGGAFVGYYKIEDTNKIFVETFYVGVGENGKYDMDYGIIKGDTIFLSDSPLINKEKININNTKIYIKKKIEGLTGTPDW
ncbi:hypothetical protein [Aquimarina muelleri]|uniref:Lipoprotein n=1 Tax=Aquimarina muelleri TaxID=279356 RepID=A0A918JTQ8_9FLAO|nr:hypothetical protein [Aquimarina muelleri]MCX2763573.1 hypothetical protein [Aquimarina muelleri]GGX14492.1 hypothetical protein GCM10007384_15090 [Aquimarina muelleri]